MVALNRALVGGSAAADFIDGPCREAELVRGQPADQLSDLFRLADPLHWDGRGDVLVKLRV